MTVTEWRDFLKQWSEEWLARDETFPPRVRKDRWLGSQPATEQQITRLEKRLGYQLPSSYRNFLLTSNGWSRASELIDRIRPAVKVDWLQSDNPELLDASSEDEPAYEPLDYFSYDGRPTYYAAHLRECLIIADPIAGDSMIYLLNPLVVAEDGEWEAWRFAHWIPGAERFPSFALLMRAEHASFLAIEKSSGDRFFGPFEGAYAPDKPRHAAKKIGQGKARPRRLTVPELIAELESPVKKVRLKAANHLLREFRPHDPSEEHTQIVEPLGRIVRSELETDVRCAAIAMLGSYGDANSIPLLIAALDDPELTNTAISALSYISIHVHDARIGDAMVLLLKTARDYYAIDQAISILSELRDSRLAEIGLRLLDHVQDIPLNIPAGADLAAAKAHQQSSLRMTGAFAFARFADHPTCELIARLTHSNSEIRVAAVAALRKDPHRGPHLESDVNPLLNDSDPAVRQQASMTIGFLKPLPKVEISPKQMAEIQSQADAVLRSHARRRKNRFR